jgi:hypothetical protein
VAFSASNGETVSETADMLVLLELITFRF